MSRGKKEAERQERARQYRASKTTGVKSFDLSTQTAFHEAGHAVFATVRGPGVEIVTIDRQKVHELTGQDYPGYTRYNESGPVGADDVLGLTVAGMTSEAMFVTGGVVNSKEDDLARLDDVLEKQMGLQGEAKQREILRTRLLSQQFATENSVAIKAVAEALLQQKTLTGVEVEQVIRTVGR